MTTQSSSHDRQQQETSQIVEEILRAIDSLRFGSIEITVHEGRVTQIERREKIRFAHDTKQLTPTAKTAANL